MRRLAPRPVGLAVERVLAETVPDTLLARVQREWPAAVGAAIACRAEPVTERGGVVTVECESAAWAAELDLMQRELAERLTAKLGHGAPRGWRFVTAGATPGGAWRHGAAAR